MLRYLIICVLLCGCATTPNEGQQFVICTEFYGNLGYSYYKCAELCARSLSYDRRKLENSRRRREIVP